MKFKKVYAVCLKRDYVNDNLKEWTALHREIRKAFPKYNDRYFRNERTAKMYLGKIRKRFPDADLSVNEVMLIAF